MLSDSKSEIDYDDESDFISNSQDSGINTPERTKDEFSNGDMSDSELEDIMENYDTEIELLGIQRGLRELREGLKQQSSSLRGLRGEIEDKSSSIENKKPSQINLHPHRTHLSQIIQTLLLHQTDH